MNKQLAELRATLGYYRITQSEIALRLGTPRSTLNMKLHQERAVDVQYIKKIESIIGEILNERLIDPAATTAASVTIRPNVTKTS